MAHWIIYDYGPGAICYVCSECGRSFGNVYLDIVREENCPDCGAQINKDETEYVDLYWR